MNKSSSLDNQTSNRRIVFVVGAGASANFDFPVGSQLADEIRKKLDVEFHESMGPETKGPLRRALDSIGFEEAHRDAARQLRAGIGPGESIDLFLFRRRGNRMVRDLGMIAVAEIILQAERRSPLNQLSLDDFETSLITLRQISNSWPIVLMEQMIGTCSPEEIIPELFSDIGFLIFNYDRCVEQTIFHYLLRRHHLPPERAQEIVRSIPMLHIYGILGDLWEGSVSFGADSTNLAVIARELKTYHDEFDNPGLEEKVRALIDPAEKIVFLGFGFHPNNFARLFPKNKIGLKQMSGTMMGAYGPTFQIAKDSIGSKFEPSNCTEFIRNQGFEILTLPWAV